jgi:hypothetical protein
MLDRFVRFFTSLKLTVALLALGLVLVFVGTMAQDPLGLYVAQTKYFKSFFVDIGPFSAGLIKSVNMAMQPLGVVFPVPSAAEALAAPRVPVFPGGYLLGGLLLINLLAAHTRYFRPDNRKIGIVMIHSGVVLLLVGQLLTDLLSTESSLHLRNGETRNYSEADRSFELAIVDTSAPNADQVTVIPGRLLAAGAEVPVPGLPLNLRVKTYYPNSSLVEKPAPGYQEIQTTAGAGPGIWWRELPRETAMDRRDMPSALVELVTPQESLGTFLVSAFLDRPQVLTSNGRRLELSLRPRRFYKPFSLHLVEFKHDRYPGTDIPRNFSSRVRLQRPATGEDREVLIYMNNPLRYAGETFYQASFDRDDQGTVLQVVRNPGWLTPYFACVLVGAGLVVQFLTHLFGHAAKRREA